MKRRVLGSLIGGVVAALPSLPDAQPRSMPVIGWLGSGSSALTSSSTNNRDAFRLGLREAGYFEGRNVAFENRLAENRYDRLPGLANELVDRKVQLIVAIGDPAAHAAKAATTTIPVVFVVGDDPVAAGLIASLARPAGNLTGVTVLTGELGPKRIELLRELLPGIGTIALLSNPANPASERAIRDARSAARILKVQLHELSAATESEIDAAFVALASLGAGALLVEADQLLLARREQIVALAAGSAIPTMFGFRAFAVAGGLISFGQDLTVPFRQIGVYAGRILSGARPADLPVAQPIAVELVVNLETAKTLGLTIPPSLLVRADEVIE